MVFTSFVRPKAQREVSREKCKRMFKGTWLEVTLNFYLYSFDCNLTNHPSIFVIDSRKYSFLSRQIIPTKLYFC